MLFSKNLFIALLAFAAVGVNGIPIINSVNVSYCYRHNFYEPCFNNIAAKLNKCETFRGGYQNHVFSFDGPNCDLYESQDCTGQSINVKGRNGDFGFPKLNSFSCSSPN